MLTVLCTVSFDKLGTENQVSHKIIDWSMNNNSPEYFIVSSETDIILKLCHYIQHHKMDNGNRFFYWLSTVPIIVIFGNRYYKFSDKSKAGIFRCQRKTRIADKS